MSYNVLIRFDDKAEADRFIKHGKEYYKKKGWIFAYTKQLNCNEVEIEKCNVCDICQNKEATRLLCEWCYEDIFNY